MPKNYQRVITMIQIHAMKSSELTTRCPVCRELIGVEGLNQHIASKASFEKKRGTQFKHEHLTYYEIQLPRTRTTRNKKTIHPNT